MSNARGIAGMRVLVAEDEVFCAMELEGMLDDLECNIVGFVSNVDNIIASAGDADCVLLDINLKGEKSYPAALALKEKGIPMVFVTGYGDLPDCPSQLASVPKLGKPFSRNALADVLGKIGKS